MVVIFIGLCQLRHVWMPHFGTSCLMVLGYVWLAILVVNVVLSVGSLAALVDIWFFLEPILSS